MPLPSSVDVAIIGAGAAGLGAANALRDSGLSAIVLEARDRVGGRAHTMAPAPGIIFDVGCGWLHSADRNSFVPIAKQLGFEVDQSRPPWRDDARQVGFPPKERAAFIAALDAFHDRAETASDLPSDSVASDWLESGNRWNPMIDAISTYVNGCELDQVSIYDMDLYEDTEINWRVRRGYGALIAAYGAPCTIALDTCVTRIDHSGTRIHVETSNGTLTAAKVIVTVPTNLIADEAITFFPALPAKIGAARGLPLGIANKTMLALDEPPGSEHALPRDSNLRGPRMTAKMGTFHIRPLGQPCIEGYFGGHFARELEEAGDGALAAQSIDEIVALLGSDFRKRLRPLAASRWATDPFARGSYSHAMPGCADCRAVLAAPVDNRLFFAGEATSPNFFSTAHGARDSGQRAAREVMQAASS